MAPGLKDVSKACSFVGALLFLTFSISFASELGLYALGRDAQSGGTQAVKRRYDDLKEDKKRVSRLYDKRAQQRP
jgi:hypothetical protein